MGTIPKAVPALGAFRAPIVDKNGMPSWEFLKVLQQWAGQLTGSINQLGEIVGTITGQIAASATIQGRTEGIGTTVGNIDSGGVVTDNGVDFSRPYLNKTTDHIADGTGNPLSGGVAAHSALVASAPVPGQALVYGADWAPGAVPYTSVTGAPVPPANFAAIASQWIRAYNALTGAFTASQPAFGDLTGTAGIPFVSFGAGAPGGASTEGYIYLDTSTTPYQAYVYHSGSWHAFA